MKTNLSNSIIEIARCFETNGMPVETLPFGDGLINDTYLVTTDCGEQYMLQRINRAVFCDVDVLQNNLLLITNHIRKCLESGNVKDFNRKVLTPIMAKDGTTWVENNNDAWRMTLFIKGSVTKSVLNPEMAELTGKAFAEFHSYFARTDAPSLKETIPDFHNLTFRLQQLKEAITSNKAGRIKECKEETEYLLARADEMLKPMRLAERGELPRRIAHCDTKLNNILFDQEGNILCVIDLDTTMPGFVLSDFGDFIRTAANTGKEDDSDLDNVNVDMNVFRFFAKGYVENAGFLTSVERDLLPFGAQMLTYMQAVRFLTDFINGDTYYKVLYPEHNMVRTRAQIKLLKSIDANLEEMNSYISSL